MSFVSYLSGILFVIFIYCTNLTTAIREEYDTIDTVYWSHIPDSLVSTGDVAYFKDPDNDSMPLYLIVKAEPLQSRNPTRFHVKVFEVDSEDNCVSTFDFEQNSDDDSMYSIRIPYSFASCLPVVNTSTPNKISAGVTWDLGHDSSSNLVRTSNHATIASMQLFVSFKTSKLPNTTHLIGSNYTTELIIPHSGQLAHEYFTIGEITCFTPFVVTFLGKTDGVSSDEYVMISTTGDYSPSSSLINDIQDKQLGSIQMLMSQLSLEGYKIQSGMFHFTHCTGEYDRNDDSKDRIPFIYHPKPRNTTIFEYSGHSSILAKMTISSDNQQIQVSISSLNTNQRENITITVECEFYLENTQPSQHWITLPNVSLDLRTASDPDWTTHHYENWSAIVALIELSMTSTSSPLKSIYSIRAQALFDEYSLWSDAIPVSNVCGTKYPNCNTPIIPTTPCDNKCDNITTICNSQNQCTCKNADLGWVIQTPSSSSSNSNDKIVCTRPCPCLNGGTCDWESSLDGSLQCMCTHNYDGPLCRDSIAPLVCNATTFLPSVCDKGTISCHDDSSSSSSSSPQQPSTICTCSSPWLTSHDVITSGYGKWCNLCPLQVQPSPSEDKPHKYCHPTNTHRVSYTTSRCANDICVCNKGYTGDTCQHNAAYAEIIFDTSNTFDGSQYTDPIAYRDALIEYITQYISTTLPIFNHDEIMEMVKLYGTDIQMDNATLQGAGGSPMISSLMSSLYSLFGVDTTLGEEPTVTDSNNWICPDGQIPTVIKTQYKCITSIKYTFIFDMTMIQDKLDKPDSGDGFTIMTNLESIYTAWNDAITDMPTKQPDITNTLGTPSTESLYDPIYCNTFLNDPTTTIPSQCLQVISYKDTEWNNEADDDDLLYGVLLPNRPSSSSDKSSNVGIIIGVVVGACVVFVVLLLVLCYLKKTKKGCFAEKQKNRKSRDTMKSSGVEFSTASERTTTTAITTATTAVPDSVGTVSSFSPVPNQTKSPLHGGSSLPSPVSGGGGNDSPHTSSIDSRPLPDGWKLLHDPNSGKVYYYNETTLTSSWKHPDDIKDDDASSLW